MARVNSNDPKHRARIRKQQAARSKKATGGKLNTHFRTRSGKLVANPKPTSFDDEGRPIFGQQLVTVYTAEGVPMKVTPRIGAALIGAGQIPIQPLGEVR